MSFFGRWAAGVKNLTPSDLLKAKQAGIIGTAIGIVLAWVVLWIKGWWYFSIIFFFSLFLQAVSYIETRKQLLTMLEWEKNFVKTNTEANKIDTRESTESGTKSDGEKNTAN